MERVLRSASFVVLTVLLTCKPDYSTAYSRGPPSFNFWLGSTRPSTELVDKWFHELNDEAERQGILCHVDLKALKAVFPHVSLKENTYYNFNWVKGTGYVMAITKVLTDSQGKTPVLDEIVLPSSTTCKYWLQTGDETCYCRYPGFRQPGDEFYAGHNKRYPVYKRKHYRPASELTVDMFGLNENPEGKLNSLSRWELVLLFRNMFKISQNSRDAVRLPHDMKREYPEIGFWTLPEYWAWGIEAEGHGFSISFSTDQSDMEIQPLNDSWSCSFSTTTRISSCTAPTHLHPSNRRFYRRRGIVASRNDDLDY